MKQGQLQGQSPANLAKRQSSGKKSAIVFAAKMKFIWAEQKISSGFEFFVRLAQNKGQQNPIMKRIPSQSLT
jgi:hypothetical protein